jgi:hypothetical protein
MLSQISFRNQMLAIGARLFLRVFKRRWALVILDVSCPVMK